jgi:hypothetical protein
MEEKELYGFIMCVCTGKCPGFKAMDIWDFINQVRVELPVEYGFIHPQLCEEDGDRFLADFLKAHRKVIIGACAPNGKHQYKVNQKRYRYPHDIQRQLHNQMPFDYEHDDNCI